MRYLTNQHINIEMWLEPPKETVGCLGTAAVGIQTNPQRLNRLYIKTIRKENV